MVVLANDTTIALAASMGSLELNAFVPIVAEKLLESLRLLTNACDILRRHCIDAIDVNRDRCRAHVETATAAVTALVEKLGYQRACDVARIARDTRRTIRDIVTEQHLLTHDQFDALVAPEAVTRLGFPIRRKD